jgi:hypothetical protein
MKTLRWVLLVVGLLGPSEVAHAELISLKILHREAFAGGKSFGEVGPYEKIVAVGRFALDPQEPHNRGIVDLELAPRNPQGKVEFESDVYLLAPKDPAKGNGAIFYDVNNRGNKLAVRFFNMTGGGNDLDKAGSEGDGFLMRRGYTVVWSGWIGELLAGDHRMLLKAPVAQENGKPLRGTVRFETGTDVPAKSLPLSRREGHGSYAPTKEGLAKAVLTKRLLEGDPRQEIAREKWRLETMPLQPVKEGVPGTLPQVRLHLEGGFEPGVIYELICEAEGSIVQGVGLAGVRDLISFLRYSSGAGNPLITRGGTPVITRAHAFGVSQSGRFLRHLLWQGFNEDEKGRIVFDGLIPHVAGGGLGFFNHRFAQPTRHNGQHEDHLYPADMFPFTYGTMTDPVSGRTDGILRVLEKTKSAPKIMHTQSAAEYWHRSGSLVHTDPLGSKDAEIPENVRIFAFGGTQHGPAVNPPPRGIADNLNNPGDYRPQLRALLDALDGWVKDGKEPPPSVYPRIDQKTLVPWDQKSTAFPQIPGVRYPQVIQQPELADYGPEFLSRWIITREPPEVKGKYVVLVSKSGADGNDLGTLLPAEVAVPVATYTGWNLRRKDVGADGMLASLLGSYLPFAKTKEERMQAGDPRMSLQERYGSFENYRKEFAENCNKMVRERYLLQEDATRLLGERGKVEKMFKE